MMGKLYTHLFAKTYDTITGGLERSLTRRKTELLSGISGRILDVGSGTGVNFRYFPEEAEVYALEPSPTMVDIARKKADNSQNITFINLGMGDTRLNDIFEPNSFDYIISTLVLCTIPDPTEALKQFHEWLKPGGRLIAMEHIHASKNLNRKFQRLINPAWKFCGDGCNLTRDTDSLIQQSGFRTIKDDYFKRTLRFYSGVFEPIN